MNYQLADLNNGPFGDVYDTIADAEAALAEIVKDCLLQAKEEILLQEEEDAEREYREPKGFSDETLVEMAEDRIREFHNIVQVMTALDLYEAAFDSANDYAEETAEYVQEYAADAFNKHVDIDACEKIAACRRAYKGMNSEGGEYAQAYNTQVRKPLEDIEL